MNSMNWNEHQESLDETTEWAEEMLASHPVDADPYWLTAEGKEVIAIAECMGLI